MSELTKVMPAGCAEDTERILAKLEREIETSGNTEKTFCRKHNLDPDFRERMKRGRVSPRKMLSTEVMLDRHSEDHS